MSIKPPYIKTNNNPSIHPPPYIHSNPPSPVHHDIVPQRNIKKQVIKTNPVIEKQPLLPKPVSFFTPILIISSSIIILGSIIIVGLSLYFFTSILPISYLSSASNLSLFYSSIPHSSSSSTAIQQYSSSSSYLAQQQQTSSYSISSSLPTSSSSSSVIVPLPISSSSSSVPAVSISSSSSIASILPFRFNSTLDNKTTIQTASFITPTDYNNPFAGNKIQVYSYLGVLIDIPNNWGSKSWFPAINRHLTTGQGYIIMTCAGDSITAGFFTYHGNQVSWCLQEGDMLRQQIKGIKDGGSGWSGVFYLDNNAPGLPIFGFQYGGTAGISQIGGGNVPTRAAMYTASAGTAFISWSVRGKYVDVYLYTLNSCNFNWTIDNGNSTYQINLTPQQTSDSSGIVTYIRTYMPLWTNTTQWQKFTLTKQTPSLTCTVNVVGVRGLNDNGLVVDVYGFAGELGQYDQINYQGGIGSYAMNIQSDLLRWQFGVNDAHVNPSLDAIPYYLATIAAMTTQINLTRTDFLVNLPAIGNFDTTIDFMSNYEFPVVNYTSRTGIAAFVSQTAIYSLGNIHTDILLQAMGGFPPGEDVHPAVAGLQMYAKNDLFLLSGGRAGNLPNSTTWQNNVDYTIFPTCSQYCLSISQTSPYAHELCAGVGGTLNTGTTTTPPYNCPV